MSDSSIDEKDAADDFPTGECFYNASFGTVRLLVSDDAMEVSVVEIVADPERCASLTPETLSAFFHKNKIIQGLRPESLKELVGYLILDPKWSGLLVVAEGRPPVVPGSAEFTMFQGASDVHVVNGESMSVEGEALAFAVIGNYFEQKRAPADIPETMTKLVNAGEILVSKTAPLKGISGQDVFGRPVNPPAFCEVIAGENVELKNDETKFTASFFGYPLLRDRILSVLSPIVVADDEMTAWFVQFPQLSPVKNPFIMDLSVLLQHAGLARGTEGKCVEDLCLQLKKKHEPGWYIAAQGQEPVPGEDGALLFEGTDPPSALRDDGSIDYKILNLVKTVEADSHFATLSLPTAGVSGYTLLDEELPAESGKPLKVAAKGNIRIEECEHGEVRYHSETEGVINYQNGTLEIDPLYQVKGNVDFSTGNIDVDCCLNVGGNVCSNFTVKSTKDVIVNGTLEPGSKLIVEGDLQVKGGIIGENTEVMVLGNLQAEYIQDAKIVVKGQILINQYAFSAIIRSVGSIQVGPGTGERGGSLVGGTICSSVRIEAKTTGSPSNVLTTVVVEPAPHKLAKLKHLKQKVAECETKITKIMRTLNLEAIEPDLVKQLLHDATAKQRELYVQILQQLNLIVKNQHELLADKNKLRDALWKDVDQMSILVTKDFFSNTRVRIAKKEFLNRTDKGRTNVIHDRTKLVFDSAKGADDAFPS